MFSSWFAPRYPVSLADKVWIELRMRWLAEQFGIEALRKAEVILPSTEYFPRDFHGTRKETEQLFERTCDWMGVPRGSVTLEIIDDTELQDAAAHYDQFPHLSPSGRMRRSKRTSPQQPIVRVQRSLLQYPPQLAKTLVHELAHDRLLRPGLIDPAERDHEQVTDLLPVFLGLGVIQANGVIHEYSASHGQWSIYQAFSNGYLNAFQLGYALALFAWLRDEAHPAWAKELRLDARSAFDAGQRWLAKTGKSQFRHDSLHAPAAPQSEREWLQRLTSDDPEIRFATVWQLGRGVEFTPKLVDAVIERLTDKQEPIPSWAAALLLQCETPPPHAIAPLVALLRSPRGADVRAALETLYCWQAAPDEVLRSAVSLLDDEREHVALVAARAIASYGALAENHAKQLVPAFIDAIVNCTTNELELAEVLCAITDHPEPLLRKFAPDRMSDPELVRDVRRSLDIARAHIAAANSASTETLSRLSPNGATGLGDRLRHIGLGRRGTREGVARNSPRWD